MAPVSNLVRCRLFPVLEHCTDTGQTVVIVRGLVSMPRNPKNNPASWILLYSILEEKLVWTARAAA